MCSETFWHHYWGWPAADLMGFHFVCVCWGGFWSNFWSGSGCRLTQQERDEVQIQPQGAWQLLNRSVRLAYRGGFTASRTQSMSTLHRRSTKSTDVLTVCLPSDNSSEILSAVFLGRHLFPLALQRLGKHKKIWATQHKFRFKYWTMAFSTLLTHWCLWEACFCSVRWVFLSLCLELCLFSLQWVFTALFCWNLSSSMACIWDLAVSATLHMSTIFAKVRFGSLSSHSLRHWSVMVNTIFSLFIPLSNQSLLLSQTYL